MGYTRAHKPGPPEGRRLVAGRCGHQSACYTGPHNTPRYRTTRMQDVENLRVVGSVGTNPEVSYADDVARFGLLHGPA